MDDPAEPRRSKGPLFELSREDLELFSVEDLKARILDLELEIDRVGAQIARKQTGRNAADALFRPRQQDGE